MAIQTCPWCTSDYAVNNGRFVGHRYDAGATGSNTVCPGANRLAVYPRNGFPLTTTATCPWCLQIADVTDGRWVYHTYDDGSGGLPICPGVNELYFQGDVV